MNIKYISIDKISAMNFEYTTDELNRYNIDVLKNIAKKYQLKYHNLKKSELVKNILKYQNSISKKSINNFENLLAELHRLLGYYLPICDIVNLCRISKKLNICANNIFLRDLAHQRLTEHDERLINRNILREIYLAPQEENILENAEKGYEKAIKLVIEERPGYYALENILVRALRCEYKDLSDYLISQGVKLTDSDILQDYVFNPEEYKNTDIVKNAALRRDPDVYHKIDIFLAAVHAGHLDIVKLMVSTGVDVHADNDAALRHAVTSKKNSSEIIRYLFSIGNYPEGYRKTLAKYLK